MLDPLQIIVEWLVVFILNVIPAFAPPTWIVLSAFYIAFPQNIFFLIAIGVTASTAGRYALAKGSEILIQKYASNNKKEDLAHLKKALNYKPMQKFLFTFIFALSPLPSNALFIAAGATKIRLREILAGFFAGRTVSYLLLVFITEKVFTALEKTLEGNATIWTVMIEVIGVLSIVAFFAIDWDKLIRSGEKNKKWPKKKHNHQK